MKNKAAPTARLGMIGKGNIIVIGGHEDKDEEPVILRELAARVGRGHLVVATFATEKPDEQWEDYRRVFRRLGVRRLRHLDARTREELAEKTARGYFKDVSVLFFAGGDQLKVTTRFGGTALCEEMDVFLKNGGVVAGTSSGASIMGETMLISGEGESTPDARSIRMAPGLGLLRGVLIDQHFAERDRVGRLTAGVAQNPRLLGLGIDEDTAAIFSGSTFKVVGSGGVYVLDGQDVTFTNISEDDGETASVYGMRLHLLSGGDKFSLETRAPKYSPCGEAAKHSAALGNGAGKGGAHVH
jgi:cyanophycinase